MAKNALARAVFFNRLGEVRDRSFEHQRYRASGLNLVVAAIVALLTLLDPGATLRADAAVAAIGGAAYCRMIVCRLVSKARMPLHGRSPDVRVLRNPH